MEEFELVRIKVKLENKRSFIYPHGEGFSYMYLCTRDMLQICKISVFVLVCICVNVCLCVNHQDIDMNIVSISRHPSCKPKDQLCLSFRRIDLRIRSAFQETLAKKAHIMLQKELLKDSIIKKYRLH